MGSAENVALVRRGYEAFNTGDLKVLNTLFAPNASWHVPGRGKLAGDYKGREATFAFFGELGQQTAGTFQVKVDSVMADDHGRVIGVHHTIADKGGKHLDVECCLVFEIKGGKVTDGREHFEDLYAWDDFWS
jgi:ketosteroid isomerase-like protein